VKHWKIGEVVRDLVLRREQEAREQQSGVDYGQSAKALEASIVEDIRTLMSADVIAPVDPETKTPVAKDLPIDGSWHLGRRDFERVQRYAWQNHPEIKKRFLDELTAVVNDGRYKLGDAADAFEIGTGERGELLVEKLRASALSGDLPMYEPGKFQRYVYFVEGKPTTHVRDFYEEAYSHDLNVWLKKHEPRITYEFPGPDDPPGIDFAATTPGVAALVRELAAQAPTANPTSAAGPVQTQVWQEEQILRTIKALDLDPLALPPLDRRNKINIKGNVRDRCKRDDASRWVGTVFDKAWTRLQARKSIKYRDK
jgi:hypothetical protein